MGPRISPHFWQKIMMSSRKTNRTEHSRRAIIIMLLPLVASAFAPHFHADTSSGKKYSPQKELSGFASQLAASSGQNPAEHNSSEEDDRSNNTPTQSNGNYTVARAGGRRPRTDSKSHRSSTTTARSVKNDDILSVFRKWALPLCLLIVIINDIIKLLGMFGGTDTSNPNVVYYSRSVYQSTTYSGDGNVETKRKEDFQSNIPGLVEKANDYSKKQNGGDMMYLDSLDEELIDLEDEMDSLMFHKW